MEVEVQVEHRQVSSTQDEDEESEEEASPNVVFAVYSELVIMARNVTHASESMMLNIRKVDVEIQKPVPV